jgi:small subunit ribosomal protein S7
MRKTKPKKRILLPDPRYKDIYVTRFVNNMMFSGKKSIAYDIFYAAMDLVEQRTKDIEKPALDIFKASLDNITPQVEVKSRRVGGATFQVPMEVRADRKTSIAMKNMILFARKRPGKSMAEKLAGEIVAGYNNEGGAYKKKEDTHRMAEANKAFAHFRF